jgi:hypothetical protein
MYVYICICMYMYIYIYIYMYIYVCICMCICIYVFMHVRVCACVRVYICTCVCVWVVYTPIHIPVCLLMPSDACIGGDRDAAPRRVPLGGVVELSVGASFPSGTIPRVRVCVSSMYTYTPLHQRAGGVCSFLGSRGFEAHWCLTACLPWS